MRKWIHLALNAAIGATIYVMLWLIVRYWIF